MLKSFYALFLVLQYDGTGWPSGAGGGMEGMPPSSMYSDPHSRTALDQLNHHHMANQMAAAAAAGNPYAAAAAGATAAAALTSVSGAAGGGTNNHVTSSSNHVMGTSGQVPTDGLKRDKDAIYG